MSSADDIPPGPERGKPSDEPALGPKRGRLVIGGTVVAVIVLVFAFMLLVSQCGDEAGDVYGQAAGLLSAV
jgi:hypothetical protein